MTHGRSTRPWHTVCRPAAMLSPDAPTAARRRRSLGELYAAHFRGGREERQFLSSVAFFVTFALVRLITHAIRRGAGPFHNVQRGTLHLHHLVWGILALLGDGYLWLGQFGTGQAGGSRWGSRLTALLYGVGSALALDEFALWLNLKDVYWAREGRESVDAVVLWGALLSIGFWGRRFFHAVWHELTRVV